MALAAARMWFKLVANIGRIAHLPIMIVQGGHDVIAPPEFAYRVHRAGAGSVLHIVPDAGHSPSEPGIDRLTGFLHR